jgi:hypothetical protein
MSDPSGTPMVDVAKPVFSGKVDAEGHHPVDLCGTAFPVGGPLFLTACHVADLPPSRQERVLIGYPQAGQHAVGDAPVSTAEAFIIERWPDLDIAALIVPGAQNPSREWHSGDLPLLARVRAAGYPFALDAASKTMAFRAFAGHIVARRLLLRFPARPGGYELSFPTPRGLSGSALLYADAIAGCVVGNESMLMDVFRDEEIIEKDGSISRHTRVEGLNVGIAIQAEVLLALRFSDGRTVRDFVREFKGRISE